MKYMHANMSNMNKYDYNHTQNQMLDTKSKAIQQIKIEDTALSNTIGLESNTLQRSLIKQQSSRFSIAYWTKNNMILLMFIRRVDEDHSSHLGVVGAGSGEYADG